MGDIFEGLRKARHEIRRIHRLLYELIILPDVFDKGLAMSALTELQALGSRIDAVTAALPPDIAAAVAAQAAADAAAITAAQDALSALQASDAADAAALETEITTLTQKIAALEAAAGLPPTGNLSITPTSIAGPVGTAISQALTISGGLAPYTTAVDPAAPAPPADVTLANNTVSVGGLVDESGSISVIATDSSTPAITSASTPISISITGTVASSLAVSPTAVTGTAGSAVTGVLSVTGGTAPYTFASSLADVTVDTNGNLGGTPAAAEAGTITVTDSSTPPQSAEVAVTIS